MYMRTTRCDSVVVYTRVYSYVYLYQDHTKTMREYHTILNTQTNFVYKQQLLFKEVEIYEEKR